MNVLLKSISYLLFLYLLLGVMTACCMSNSAETGEFPKMVSELCLFDKETIRATYYLQKTEDFMAIGESKFPAAYAFKVVSESPNSNKIFHYIYETGGRVGKIYALAGLYYDDRDFVYKAIDHLLTLDSVRLDAHNMFKSESPSAVRLSKECPTIASWYEQHSTSNRTFVVDVYGGALSEMFFDTKKVRYFDLERALEREGVIAPR